MTLDDERPTPLVRWHEECGGPNLRVLTAQTESGEDIEVSRCMMCDTAKCPKCAGRTLDPTAKMCKHCGTDIQIKVKLPDDASE